MRATSRASFQPTPARVRTTFADRFAASLDLTIGSSPFSFPAGSLEFIRIKAAVHGFEAEVVLGIVSDQEEDPLLSSFTTNDLITATLTLANGNEGFADEDASPWKMTGPVTLRQMLETTAEDRSGIPVVIRRYGLRFFDPARVFWGQHRPTELWTGASMKDVLGAHTPAGMQIEVAWPRFEEAQAMLFVGTGSHARASFYDLVVWFVQEHGGILEFDGAKTKYRFASKKSDVAKKVQIDPDQVAKLSFQPSEPRRNSARVLNAYTEAAVKKTSVTNDDAVTGVSSDALVRTPLQPPVDRRVAEEKGRLAPGREVVRVEFSRLTAALPILLGGIELGPEFSDKHLPFGRTYRVIEAELEARIESPVDVGDPDDDTAQFVMSYVVHAERVNESRPRLPPFHRLAGPLYVEGKVLSTTGAEKERTWSAQDDENDALDAYRVHIPLWNKTITTPFLPDHVPGQFFFPCYRGQRVLVALHFDHAEIVRDLDWAGKLAQATQGDQILWGKGDKNETYARHVYEQEKPVFTVLRKMAGDTETLKISEGVIRLEVQEFEEAATVAPSYDLTPKTDAAKDALASEVGGSIANVSGTYESSMGETQAALNGATTEVEGAIGTATATIESKLGAAEGELQTMMSSATGAIVEATAAVEDAKSELTKALYE